MCAPARATASLEPFVPSILIQTTTWPAPLGSGAKKTYQPSLILSPFTILSGVPVLPATKIPNWLFFGALCSLIYVDRYCAYKESPAIAMPCLLIAAFRSEEHTSDTPVTL